MGNFDNYFIPDPVTCDGYVTNCVQLTRKYNYTIDSKRKDMSKDELEEYIDFVAAQFNAENEEIVMGVYRMPGMDTYIQVMPALMADFYEKMKEGLAEAGLAYGKSTECFEIKIERQLNETTKTKNEYAKVLTREYEAKIEEARKTMTHRETEDFINEMSTEFNENNRGLVMCITRFADDIPSSIAILSSDDIEHLKSLEEIAERSKIDFCGHKNACVTTICIDDMPIKVANVIIKNPEVQEDM